MALIPTKARLAHTLILTGSGGGKTSLLKAIIREDILNPCTVVVFDSQGDLVEDILQLDIPRDRVVLIDPEDIKHPIALGLFDFETDDDEYHAEKQLNLIVSLLTYAFETLMKNATTGNQSTVLTFVIQLCLRKPGANLRTMYDLLGEGGFTEEYMKYVKELPSVAQDFFYNDFQKTKGQYAETKEQLRRRLLSVLSTPSLARLFESPTRKLNVREAIDAGSVILINTAKSFLGEENSAFFSRFMLVLLNQAIQSRDPLRKNMPTFIHIDEASPIIDDNVGRMLDTVRKYGAGLTLCLQSISKQSVSSLVPTLFENTAVKVVGRIGFAADAQKFKSIFAFDPETLMQMPQFTFYVAVKGGETIHYTTERDAFEDFPRRTDMKQLIAENRAKYSVTPEKPTEEVKEKESGDIDGL